MAKEIVIQKPILDQSNGVFTLSSNVLLDGAEHKLYYRTSSFVPEVTSNPFLAVALLVGMKLGWPIKVEGKVSKKLLSNIRMIQEIFHSWYPDFQKIEIDCEGFSDIQRAKSGGVGCFFSGGVDSFYSVLKHKDEITKLIFVHGFDIKLSDSVLREKVSSQLEKASEELGKPLIQVETNIRDFADSFLDWGLHFHGAAIGSVALFASNVCSNIFIASTDDYASLQPWGSHPLLDPLWGTENLSIVYDGCEENRVQKVERIASDVVVQNHLRVCWEHPKSEYNCGECSKCTRTMAILHICDALKKVRTFDKPLELALLARARITSSAIQYYSEFSLKCAKERNLDALFIRALQDMVDGVYYTGFRGAPRRALGFIDRKVLFKKHLSRTFGNGHHE